MTVNAQTMLELEQRAMQHCARWGASGTSAEMLAHFAINEIERAALRSPAIAGVAAREALERISKIDRHEKKITVETDPAGNTYRVEMIDGPCATVARDALAALPQEAPAPPQADAVLDPELARTLTDNAAYVQSIRAATIEECAKLIESGAGMADLIDQDDLDQQAKYIRAIDALSGKPSCDCTFPNCNAPNCDCKAKEPKCL